MTTQRYRRPRRRQATGLISEQDVEQTLAEFAEAAQARRARRIAAGLLAQPERPEVPVTPPPAAPPTEPSGLRAFSDKLSQLISVPIQAAVGAEQRIASTPVGRAALQPFGGPQIQNILTAMAAINKGTLPFQRSLLVNLLGVVPGKQPGQQALEEAGITDLSAIEEAKAQTKLPFGVVGAVEAAVNPLTYAGVRGIPKTAVTKPAAKAPIAAEPRPAQAAETVVPKSPETIPSSAAGQVIPPVPGPAASKPPAGGGKPPLRGGRPRVTGAPPAREPFAANIRLSKFPEDLRPIIKEWADANPEAVQTARRGVRSDAQVLEDARSLVNDLGGDFERLVKQWKPGQAWNAEEITALRGSLDDVTRAIVDAQAKLRAGIDTSENHLRLVEAVYRRAQVQEAVHGVTAEAGRSLRAFRQQATEALQNRDVVRMGALLKQLEGKGTPDQIAAMLEKIDLNNPAKVSEAIRGMVKPRGWEYPLEVLINSYLSAPTSHTINALSNAGMVSLSPIRRGLAAAIEAGVAPLQGRARQRFFAEVPADVIGAVQGVPEGLRSFLYTMRNGMTPEAALKYEIPRMPAFTGKLGVFVNAPTRLMSAADQLFYHINYRAALNAEAVRVARRSPKPGMGQVERAAELITNPSTELIEKAVKTAEYNLFRSEPGDITRRILGLRDSELLGVPWGRFLVPFVRTPANLLKTALGHSPAGLFDPKMWTELIRKDPAFADRFASVLLGTAVASTIALYFAKGNMTGPVPSNRTERDKFFRDGKVPYAVKIGDTWIQYRRLEPFNLAFNLIGTAIEAYQSGDEKTAEAKAWIVIGALGKNFLDQPYMTGFSTIQEAIEDPAGPGAVFLEGFASGFVPYSSALRQAATTIDPTYRKPEGLGERLEANIPGQTENVPPKLTAFGEQSKRTSPSLVPIVWSQEAINPVEAELTRLNIDIGFVGTTFGGVRLSRSQQAEYQTLAGQRAKANLLQVLDLPQYQILADELKQQVIQAITDAARRQARYELKIGKEPRPGDNARPLRILERLSMAQSPLVLAYRDAGDAVLRDGGHEELIDAYHEYLKADNLTQAAMNRQYKNLFKQTVSAVARVRSLMRQKNALLDGYYVRYEDGSPKHTLAKKYYQDILATDIPLEAVLVR